MDQYQPPAYPGVPQVYPGQPQVYVNQTQVYVGQPQVYQGQPQVYVGQTQVYVGQTQVYVGQPQVYVGQPQVNQSEAQVNQSRSDKHQDNRSTSSESGSKCPKCCLKTRNCLMSGECGRALEISRVIAQCASCFCFFLSTSSSSRCPNHLIWLLSMWRSSGFTVSSPRVGRASHPISKGENRLPAEETHSGRMYPRSCPFGHNPKLMTIGEDGNVDRPVN
ncbi:uncharacterized protein [Nerophis lumbriciformis]|uniref:uncharacterized protein n=1 Tax=Nerophis lumbriciformis TaxID=546530 RepID=UPI003BAA95C9